ncbi:probable chitinase 10 [Uranotaenia lowii]|uniref:probable chitinase 10 n=1 Tax=Uranotaenia lowii TaxID=190385 RepID=UPI002479ED6D|nr:probable chitinase 10 [Uranotaenia lowii]
MASSGSLRLSEVLLGVVLSLVLVLSRSSADPQVYNNYNAYEVQQQPAASCSSYRPKIVCFVSAAADRYDTSRMPPGLCSHLVLIDLIGLNCEGKLTLLQQSSRALTKFLDLKHRFQAAGDPVRFVLAIGGIYQKSTHFSQALSDETKIFNVVDNIITFVTKHGFDGVDVAWFYPGQFGGRRSDKANLVLLLQELQLRLQACGMSLSLTVGVDPRDIETSYDVPQIDQYVDFVNLLAGDYHSPRKPSHVSPLHGGSPNDRLNVVSMSCLRRVLFLILSFFSNTVWKATLKRG